MIEIIFNTIKNNLKNPRLYIFFLSVIIIILLLFPYIDANIFYYKRVENRIDILNKISQIDINKFEDNEILLREYENILSEVEKQSDGSISSIFIKESNKNVSLMKFIIGGSLFWITAFLCFFIKKFNIIYKLLSFIIISIIGYFSGLISQLIPTIINPIVNYIGYPLVLTIIIVLFNILDNNKNEENNNE